MAKLSVNDLEKIKSDSAPAIAFQDRTYCLICGGTGCHATGSIAVKTALEQEIESKGIADRVKVVETGCNGFCAMGPLLVVHPGDIFYQKLTADDIPELVESQLVQGQAVERL
ncbi:MAG: (2Fe-2S) ferredoxin domain-containing protein, partial [Desulfobacterales bacterium]